MPQTTPIVEQLRTEIANPARLLSEKSGRYIKEEENSSKEALEVNTAADIAMTKVAMKNAVII